MSVINQLLLDLEKRRASSAERAVLPGHVRALPRSQRELRWGWMAAAAIAGAGLAGAWTFAPELQNLLVRVERAPAPAPAQPDAQQGAVERVLLASAGAAGSAAQEGEGGDAGFAPELRLSLELSRLPEPGGAADAPRAPLPISRVVGREEAKAPASRAVASAPRSEPAAKAVSEAAPQPEIRKQLHQPAPREHAENKYRDAAAHLHQGRLGEALEALRAALEHYPAHHGARQALAGVLLQMKQSAEAERVLQEGLKLAPGQIGFAMTLARLQVERGEEAQAIATLTRSLDAAQSSAEYLAFLAVLLQRQGRHEEAVRQFQAALRLKPAGVWLLGLGLSLQLLNRAAEAREAYRSALAGDTLGPELAAFAEQRLRQLQ